MELWKLRSAYIRLGAVQSIEQKIGPHVSEKRIPLADATCDAGSRSLELETGRVPRYFPWVYFRGKKKSWNSGSGPYDYVTFCLCWLYVGLENLGYLRVGPPQNNEIGKRIELGNFSGMLYLGTWHVSQLLDLICSHPSPLANTSHLPSTLCPEY